MFVTNVKVVIKERGTEHVTHCGEFLPISTCAITTMGGLQDFTERLLFIHTLKGKSVVQTCHENIAVSWNWVPLPSGLEWLVQRSGVDRE